jgi:hypothetical protein
MATTPPIQTLVHTPPTPLHGARYDDYQPYSTRKSSRLSTQRAARTPSPEVLVPRKRISSRSKNSSAVLSAAHTYSPPSSAQASPQKRSRKAMASSATEQQNTEDEFEVKGNKANGNLAVDVTMLPTPAKTPLKKRSQPVDTSTARVLFATNRTENVDDAMPTPTKNGRRSKRHIGFLLDEDASSDVKEEIHTDVKNRVPELDESVENPFYDKPGAQNTGKRRRISSEPHDGPNKDAVQSALERNEGMVYVL